MTQFCNLWTNLPSSGPGRHRIIIQPSAVVYLPDTNQGLAMAIAMALKDKPKSLFTGFVVGPSLAAI